MAKYSAKASDYTHSEEVLDTFYAALQHTRMLTSFGRCRDLRDQYEDGKLSQYEELDTVRYTMRVVYIWQRVANSYDVHDAQAYDMDAAELERLQRDERKLQAMAMEKAKRATELDELFRTSWVREFAKVDDADMEVIDD